MERSIWVFGLNAICASIAGIGFLVFGAIDRQPSLFIGGILLVNIGAIIGYQIVILKTIIRIEKKVTE